jgi:hypothetical protein
MDKDQMPLDVMRERHAFLDSMIRAEYARPRPDDGTLRYLKLEKLHVKEEIDRLRHH